MGRYLVVANQTLGGDQLMAEVRRRAAAGPSSFYVIVPSTRLNNGGRLADVGGAARGAVPPGPSSTLAAEDEHRATLIAQSRLNQALTQLRSEGLEVEGDIGDPEPLTAMEDALAGQRFDEIIISTLPSGISHWLRMDLPQRAERKFKLPVTTITTRH
jgi:GABA permease